MGKMFFSVFFKPQKTCFFGLVALCLILRRSAWSCGALLSLSRCRCDCDLISYPYALLISHVLLVRDFHLSLSVHGAGPYGPIRYCLAALLAGIRSLQSESCSLPWRFRRPWHCFIPLPVHCHGIEEQKSNSSIIDDTAPQGEGSGL